MLNMDQKIVIVGAGVAGVNAATKLVDNGYPGKDITIIDMGKDPYERKPEEVMTGFLGAGGWSDGKLTYHTAIGGHMSKYCGEEKAMELFDEVINNFKRFHPKPEEVQCSNPEAEPDFIKPYFGLRLFPVWHVGTDYLHEIGKNWYDYLVSKGVNFIWETKVTRIDFKTQEIFTDERTYGDFDNKYDRLIFAVGKSGIDFAQSLQEKYTFPTEPKPVQIGVRFEAPQHHFQKLIDISYDFKLYRKFEDKGVSLRSFCTNNNAAYVAVEETYGDYSYNGHAKKDMTFKNDMTNFGILMEIRGVENPFEWSRKVVKESFHGYFDYITDFIEDMKKVFPTLGDDWGIYIPEVKYLSPEPLVDYSDLSLKEHSNVHFVGDALSARGITVSGAQGILSIEKILEEE